jgi:hypothetical protein
MTKPDEKEELKRCPFCNSEAKKYSDNEYYHCSNTMCPAYEFVGTLLEWNTRQSPVILPEKKEQPKGICECHAHSEDECGCGNYPSDKINGFNEAIDLISKMNEGARHG